MRRPPERPTPTLGAGRAAQRTRYFVSQRAPGSGSPEPSYLEAVVEKDRQAAGQPASPAWRPLGPFSIAHGQTYGGGPRSRPAASGRVSCIAIDPVDARHILIGAAGGGVWQTKDRGEHWTPVTDDQPSLFIGAVTFDPQKPTIAYAGTGEGNTNVGEYSAGRWLGVGLLKSTDGGDKWSLISRKFLREGFYDLKVDAQNPANLWAATTCGLFRSPDGEKWDCISEKVAWSVTIAKLADGSTEILAATKEGLLRSHDGGGSWSQVILPHAPSWFTRVAVCHAPSTPAVAYVFGAADAAYLWRRGAEHGTFDSMDGLPDVPVDQSSYDWCAAVAAGNGPTETLYLGVKEVYRGLRPAHGVWEWATISKRESGDSIHPDQHAIAPSLLEPDVLYAGCDGGLYRSEDAGLSWTSLNRGLAIAEFEFLAQHPQFDAWLLGGTQDNGTLRFEGNPTWTQVATGDGGDCAVDEFSPDTCYHGFNDMGLQRSDSGGGPGSWYDIGPNVPIEETSKTGGSLFYPPAAAFGKTVVQAAISVYLSRDGGTSWRKIPLPAGQLASSLAMASGDLVYVGTISGEVYRVEFADGAWRYAAPCGRPAPGFVSDLTADPQQPSRVWVTYSSLEDTECGRVFRSDDGGGHWINASANFPQEIRGVAVNVVEVDPTHSDSVYLGLDVGVWRSANALAGEADVMWGVLGGNLPNALVKDLKFHGASRLLRAATQSRGVWEIPVDGDPPAKSGIYLRDCAVERGRRAPERINANDPFLAGGAQMFWWQSPDIKMDAYPFQTSSVDGVDAAFFADDTGAAASGLRHVNPWPDARVRAYVQVHNGGLQAAREIEARLFYTDAALALPDLPTTFWKEWDKAWTLPDSPWKEAAAGPRGAVTADIASCGVSNVPSIVPFEWTIADNVAATLALLAVVRAKNDPLDETERTVWKLAPQRKCAIKNVALTNPPNSVAAPALTLVLRLWGSDPKQKYSLGADGAAIARVRGVLLSHGLSPLAAKAGLMKVDLDNDSRSALDNLRASAAELRDRIDWNCVYRIKESIWLRDVELNSHISEPLVLVVDPASDWGHASVMQYDADQMLVGGFSIQVDQAGRGNV